MVLRLNLETWYCLRHFDDFFFVFTLCDQVNVRWGDDRYGYFRFRCHHCPHFRRHKLGAEKKYFYIIILLYTFSLKNISEGIRDLTANSFGQSLGTLGRHMVHWEDIFGTVNWGRRKFYYCYYLRPWLGLVHTTCTIPLGLIHIKSAKSGLFMFS